MPHAAEIDPKYDYLLQAPAMDDAGNPTVVRYSRKTAEIYVQSEHDKKATGWKAFYSGSQWQAEGSAKAVKKTTAKKPAAKKVAKKVVKKVAKKAAPKKAAAKTTEE